MNCPDPIFLPVRRLGTIALALASAITFSCDQAAATEPVGDPPTLVLKWGSRGFGPGLLYLPKGMACDAEGNLYVADRGNDRIQVFNGSGQYLRHWGTRGQGPDQFGTPTAVAIGPDGLVYVSDSDNQAVKVFTTGGAFVRTWAGGVGNASGVAVDDSGYVYTCSSGGSGWKKFTATGESLGWFGHDTGPGYVLSPTGIATDGRDYVYVDGGYVMQYRTNGEFIRSFATVGDVSYLATDRNGNVYAAEFGYPGGLAHGLIEMFSPDGKLLASWGARVNDVECGFNNPSGIAVDDNGNIFVADTGQFNYYPMCIQKFAFTPTPVLRRTWGQIKAIYR